MNGGKGLELSQGGFVGLQVKLLKAWPGVYISSVIAPLGADARCNDFIVLSKLDWRELV